VTSRAKKALTITAAVLAVLAASLAVVIQQYGAWAEADPERNVTEYNSYSTLDGCMSEIDGIWLPWLRADMHDMCTAAISED
jgi:hypothetical protein